jgi:hypothetical protein
MDLIARGTEVMVDAAFLIECSTCGLKVTTLEMLVLRVEPVMQPTIQILV